VPARLNGASSRLSRRTRGDALAALVAFAGALAATLAATAGGDEPGGAAPVGSRAVPLELPAPAADDLSLTRAEPLPALVVREVDRAETPAPVVRAPARATPDRATRVRARPAAEAPAPATSPEPVPSPSPSPAPPAPVPPSQAPASPTLPAPARPAPAPEAPPVNFDDSG
jgi:hypothetical protein